MAQPDNTIVIVDFNFVSSYTPSVLIMKSHIITGIANIATATTVVSFTFRYWESDTTIGGMWVMANSASPVAKAIMIITVKKRKNVVESSVIG